MIQRTLIFAILLTTTASFGQVSTLPQALNLGEIEQLNELTTAASRSSEVFFKDPERKMYYIDFEATKTQIVQLQLWKNQEKLVKNEDTYELPHNTIFELNIEDLKPGDYSIELTTIDDDVIIQVFKVEVSTKPVAKNNK